MNPVFQIRLLAAAAMLLAAPSWATTLSFQLASSSVQVGDTVQVNVVVSDVDTSAGLGSFDLNVLFDSTLLSFSSYSLGSSLGSLSASEALDLSSSSTGSINLAEVSLLSDLSSQSSSFTLATLTFTALTAGTSSLSYASSALLGDGWGNAVTVSTASSALNISAVPEPSNVGLLLAGLGVIAVARRRA